MEFLNSLLVDPAFHNSPYTLKQVWSITETVLTKLLRVVVLAKPCSGLNNSIDALVEHCYRETCQVHNCECVSYLSTHFVTHGHKDMLLQKFITLHEVPSISWFINNLPHFSGIHLSDFHDIDWSAEFAMTHVSLRIILINLFLVIKMEILNNRVYFVLSPICHIVCEHLSNFFLVKASSPAKLEQEDVIMPWIYCYIVLFNPFLELLKAFVLSY